jgi:hypothetical protein
VSIAAYLVIKACKDRARGSNAAYVNKKVTKNNEQDMNDIDTFRSGYWTSRYFQYGKWHGPHRFSLSFDIQSMKVTGSGSDDIGKFTIKGVYSIKTNRIGLKKKYKSNTGNLFENVGQHATIRLSWNSENKQFEGKWHVYMGPQRHGKDQFELKFDEEEEESSECEKL